MKKILLVIMIFFNTLIMANSIKEYNLVESKSKKTIKIADIKEKTYIKLWASWCSVCKNTMEDTYNLSKEKNLDFKIMAVATPKRYGEKSIEEIEKWFSKTYSTFTNMPIYYDMDAKLIRTLRISAFPTNVFLNSEGEIVYIYEGHLSSNDIKELMKEIK